MFVLAGDNTPVIEQESVFFSSCALWLIKKEGCFDTADVAPAQHKAVTHGTSQVQAAALDVPGNNILKFAAVLFAMFSHYRNITQGPYTLWGKDIFASVLS